ncbi:MAG: malate synthase A [Sulfobacillus thermosulfidooxidans]|nr:MAG: malate synthase A [Sulfobacillus thermosulfidooxidans]
MRDTTSVTITGTMGTDYETVLTDEACYFLGALHEKFEDERQALLAERQVIQHQIDQGLWAPAPSPDRGNWTVGAIPADLMDRRVEITGPVDRKMVINALNSGAKVFMADFEDANAPTWANIIQGQINLTRAIERRIDYTAENGKTYRLGDKVATLVVRPRGWHLLEKHLEVEGVPMSASLVDFGLYVFHNAQTLLQQGTGPYFYLPKLESAREARLWNQVFDFTEDRLGLQRGTIKATVLIETILGALEMEEILYELKDHAVGLNAGRWDYIFSIIKKFRHTPQSVLPDRAAVTMTVPFMRAYTQRLVQVCHKHGAHAMGGMAAFIPSRRDPAINREALAKVREDKTREANDGFDGTWVAHPDLVPVAMEAFDRVLGTAPNQKHVMPQERVSQEALLTFTVPGGRITEAGIRNNISVAIQYIESWLKGQGAVAIFHLMEDAATAEIARAQIWQWIHQHAVLDDGRTVTRELVQMLEEDEIAKLRQERGESAFNAGKFSEAIALFEEVALGEDFPEFLTIPGYAHLAS